MTFSNGTEFMIFQENNCEKCQHFVEDKDTKTQGCPITDMQIISDYDVQKQISDIFFEKFEGYIVNCKCFRGVE